jgi:predicted O-methyltransferase YrrM
MEDERWAKVDRYFVDLFVGDDPDLAAALRRSAEASLPAIQVSPAQGQWLQLLARAIGARRILEIGTLAGYSTIFLARALPPGGHVVTLEADPKHADVARENLESAGLAPRVDIRLGRASDTLRRLAQEPAEPFDFVFIDADKPSYPEYFEKSLALSRSGTVIVADNVVREGEVVDAQSRDENVRGVRRFLEMAAAEPRVRATGIQTVGGKGYDGFALILVT